MGRKKIKIVFIKKSNPLQDGMRMPNCLVLYLNVANAVEEHMTFLYKILVYFVDKMKVEASFLCQVINIFTN